MDHVWEAYYERVDWEGYTTDWTQLSLHRTPEGAEQAVKNFKELHPSLAVSPGYSIDIRARKLED